MSHHASLTDLLQNGGVEIVRLNATIHPTTNEHSRNHEYLNRDAKSPSKGPWSSSSLDDKASDGPIPGLKTLNPIIKAGNPVNACRPSRKADLAHILRSSLEQPRIRSTLGNTPAAMRMTLNILTCAPPSLILDLRREVSKLLSPQQTDEAQRREPLDVRWHSEEFGLGG